MDATEHWCVFLDNTSTIDWFIKALMEERLPEFSTLSGQQGVVFSRMAMERLMVAEEKHDITQIKTGTGQSLRSLSSGQKKKALLEHILSKNPDFMVMLNPFDNLDAQAQEGLKQLLMERKSHISFIQLVSRKRDALPFIKNHYYLRERKLLTDIAGDHSPKKLLRSIALPPPLYPIPYDGDVLIALKDINVAFGQTHVLRNIYWTIKKGSFWQLIGKNGSGKTTLLSMITGENPKGYGQDLHIFGTKKGSGESIWDIRKKIGYYTPAMTAKFNGRHSVEHMLISGLNDSIGLYQKPTETQRELAKQWLALMEMSHLKSRLFCDLTVGQQRLVMTARAMVKHPPLLILDEPTASLDDASAALLVRLVNVFAQESDTAVIFVSHRKETGLRPQFTYELLIGSNGSTGHIKKGSE
ncbi:MAG: ATP-binding cassette domain-containing protein [Flavobacteriaceae bacterium]